MFDFVKNATYFFALNGFAESSIQISCGESLKTRIRTDVRIFPHSAGIPDDVVLTGENFEIVYLINTRHHGDGGLGVYAPPQFWGKNIQTNTAKSKSGAYFENLLSF